jgi:hypothetical protein
MMDDRKLGAPSHESVFLEALLMELFYFIMFD